MTSKEALQRIKDFKVVLNNRSDDYESFNPIPLYYDKELKIIEKDLEVCEELKNNVDVDMNIYDQEEIYENCTVQIWSNSKTGKVSIGWWRNDG